MSYTIAVCVDTGAEMYHPIVERVASHAVGSVFVRLLGPKGMTALNEIPSSDARGLIHAALQRPPSALDRPPGDLIAGEYHRVFWQALDGKADPNHLEEALSILQWLDIELKYNPLTFVCVR